MNTAALIFICDAADVFRTHTYLYKIPKTRENEKDFVRGDVFQQLSAVAEWCGNEMPLRRYSNAHIYVRTHTIWLLHYFNYSSSYTRNISKI